MTKDKTEIIVSDIVKNEKNILDILKDKKEAFDVYRFLRKEYNKGDISNNSVFKFGYRNHYGLENGGLTTEQKEKFFRLMVQEEMNLKNILINLYHLPNVKGYNSIQFSFATKLIHFLDIDSPIWDRKVGKALHLKIDYGRSKEKDPEKTLKGKIKVCLDIYEELQDTHSILRRNKDVVRIIKELRKEVHLEEETFSDTKVLDSILWALGDIEIEKEIKLRKKAKEKKKKQLKE